MSDFKLLNNEIKCPSCHKILNAHANMENGEHINPQQNDLSCCAFCGQFFTFVYDQNKLKLVELSQSEFDELSQDLQNLLLRTRSAALKCIQKRKNTILA